MKINIQTENLILIGKLLFPIGVLIIIFLVAYSIYFSVFESNISISLEYSNNSLFLTEKRVYESQKKVFNKDSVTHITCKTRIKQFYWNYINILIIGKDEKILHKLNLSIPYKDCDIMVNNLNEAIKNRLGNVLIKKDISIIKYLSKSILLIFASSIICLIGYGLSISENDE